MSNAVSFLLVLLTGVALGGNLVTIHHARQWGFADLARRATLLLVAGCALVAFLAWHIVLFP